MVAHEILGIYKFEILLKLNERGEGDGVAADWDRDII